MVFEPRGGGVVCEFEVPARYQSWEGMVHGGIVALMLDEALGWAAWHAQVPGVTARLEVKLRAPLRVGERVVVSGRVDRVRRSLVYASAQIVRGEVPLAEASGTLMAMRTEVAAGLSRIGARRGLAQFG